MTQQGRRRRKRRPDYTPPPKRGQHAAPAEPVRPVKPARRRGRPERPPAPWGRFPLVELVVVTGLVLVVVGFASQQGNVIVLGILVGALAGLEVSVREHFSGFKSHTILLAATPAVIVIGLGAIVVPPGWPRVVALVVAVLTFVLLFVTLREAFRRRSGGLDFRF